MAYTVAYFGFADWYWKLLQTVQFHNINYSENFSYASEKYVKIYKFPTKDHMRIKRYQKLTCSGVQRCQSVAGADSLPSRLWKLSWWHADWLADPKEIPSPLAIGIEVSTRYTHDRERNLIKFVDFVCLTYLQMTRQPGFNAESANSLKE